MCIAKISIGLIGVITSLEAFRALIILSMLISIQQHLFSNIQLKPDPLTRVRIIVVREGLTLPILSLV
jgi:hypothetical protein